MLELILKTHSNFKIHNFAKLRNPCQELHQYEATDKRISRGDDF